jgi:hypothetical protein
VQSGNTERIDLGQLQSFTLHSVGQAACNKAAQAAQAGPLRVAP